MGTSVTFVVNNYDNSGVADDDTTLVAPLAYFVAGAARGDDDDPLPALRGDELIEGTKFKDDLRDPAYAGRTFYRWDGATKTTASAATLSSELLTRGGWRDRTDGNRVSTTRGDCIDVVYGNYKLVVLGRIANAFDPSGNGGLGDANNDAVNGTLQHSFWEASGGHVAEGTSAEGKVVSAVWRSSTQDGSWETLEQTDHGDKKVRWRGSFSREHYGPSITRKVGCGCDAVAIDGGANTAAAHAAARPDVTTERYARSITHTEVVDTTKEELTAHDDLEERVLVANRYEKTTLYGEVIDGKAAWGFKDELLADTIELKNGFETSIHVRAAVVAVKTDVFGVRMVNLTRASYFGYFAKCFAEATAALRATCRIGKASDIRLGTSVESWTGTSMRIHATADITGGLWRMLKRLKKSEAKVAQFSIDADMHKFMAAQFIS